MAKTLAEIKDSAEELKSKYASRDELFTELEQIAFLDWADRGNVQARAAEGNVKITVSPDPRNQFLSSVQLLSSAIPLFKIPNSARYLGGESSLERFINGLWNEMNKLYGSSLLYDMIFSAQLYGEVHFATTDMQDFLGYYKKKGTAYERRAKRAAKRSPFLGEVFNAHECYADYDKLGLVAHYRRVKTKARMVAGEHGDAGVKAVLGLSDGDDVFYNEWWDLDDHAIWLDEGEQIMIGEHEMPFIPIETVITDGSQHMFKDTRYQRQPFLYAVAKSGLWERQNLSLSALYTLIFETGFSPLFAYQRNQEGKELDLDFSGPFTVVNLDQGEGFTSLGKNIVDPSIEIGMNIANALVEDSTIFRTARGQSIGANAAYSTHALLTQSGRLPLVTPQKRIEWLLGSSMEKCLERMATGGNRKVRSMIEEALDDVKIPEDAVVEATLEVRMPQDNLQAANIATALKQAGLVSDEWIQGKLLQIEQPEEMRKEIAKELMINFLRDQQIQKLLQEEQMKQQQKQMQMQSQVNQQEQAMQQQQAQQAQMMQQQQVQQMSQGMEGGMV